MFQEEYDVIVVGAGHAGSEAAAAANQVQKPLVTMSLQNIAQMSCNSMGGIARANREMMLGGYSGIVSDRTAIHLRC
jgi:tRNA uridine 5-carboxymethylaminomethyl modification enzyme